MQTNHDHGQIVRLRVFFAEQCHKVQPWTSTINRDYPAKVLNQTSIAIKFKLFRQRVQVDLTIYTMPGIPTQPTPNPTQSTFFPVDQHDFSPNCCIPPSCISPSHHWLEACVENCLDHARSTLLVTLAWWRGKCHTLLFRPTMSSSIESSPPRFPFKS